MAALQVVPLFSMMAHEYRLRVSDAQFFAVLVFLEGEINVSIRWAKLSASRTGSFCIHITMLSSYFFKSEGQASSTDYSTVHAVEALGSKMKILPLHTPVTS